MNIRPAIFTIALLATCTCAQALELPTGALPVSANRIVGLWDTQVIAGPCHSGITTFRGRGLNVFHAGGTVSATNNLPPTANGPTYGVWVYRGHGDYRARMQFFRYLPDGSFDGVQDIHRSMLLSGDGQRTDETTNVRVLNADGSLRVELCGAAIAQRVR